MHDETVNTKPSTNKKGLLHAILETVAMIMCAFFALHNILGEPAHYFMGTLWSILCGSYIYSSIKAWIKYAKNRKAMLETVVFEGEGV